MADPSSPSADGPDAAEGDASADRDAGAADDIDALRREVEEKYDFEKFGPADMAEMTAEEWDAAFDPDSWITGAELLDRVEADLRRRVARREVFAVVERTAGEGGDGSGDGDRIVAYSDEGYAVVYPDGSVEGEGTVLRDVKPTVALCSMDEYEVAAPPENVSLPRPEDVARGGGELGNWMLQIVGAAQLLVGLGLLIAWIVTDLSTIAAPVAGGLFVLVGAFFFLVVANARLSDRFRAEEYRDRLRSVGIESGDPPEHLPVDARRSDGERRSPEDDPHDRKRESERS